LNAGATNLAEPALTVASMFAAAGETSATDRIRATPSLFRQSRSLNKPASRHVFTMMLQTAQQKILKYLVSRHFLLDKDF
jgi:hypothetical protein